MPPASGSTRAWISADRISYPEEPVVEAEQKTYPWAALFPAWHARARCRDVEDYDDMFFGEGEDATRTSLTISRIKEVKEFCKQCPVFSECLTHALVTPERHGIWAGTSKRTRLRILALMEQGKTTVADVVADYMSGRERRYESARRPR